MEVSLGQNNWLWASGKWEGNPLIKQSTSIYLDEGLQRTLSRWHLRHRIWGCFFASKTTNIKVMQPIMTVFQCSCRPSMYPNKTGRYPPQSYGLLHFVPSRKVILCTSLHKACVMEHPDLNQISMGFLSGSICQWEFQEPKMEVLYHIRPYFVGIFPHIGLT